MKDKLQILSKTDLRSGIVAKPDEVILINDIEASTEWLNRLANLVSPNLLIANGRLLTEILAKKYQKVDLDVFPGKGAQRVKSELAWQVDNNQACVLTTSRNNQNQIPKVDFPEGTSKLTSRPISSIQIIDDAVCTGSTLQAARAAINWEILASMDTRQNIWERFSPPTNSLPGEYYALAWLELVTSNRDLEGFTDIQSATTYRGISGRPALNSLSTLIDSGTKPDQVREGYASRYGINPAQLINFLTERN